MGARWHRELTPGRRRFAALATVVLLVGTAPSGAHAAAIHAPPPLAGAAIANPVQAALPGAFIARYRQRGRACKGFFEPPWVSWITYANGTVGDQWNLVASSKSLCAKGRSAASGVLEEAPHNDGAGQVLADMIAYAKQVGHGTTDVPVSSRAARGWRCFAQPSFWGAQAWSVARLAHHAAPTDTDLAGSSGAAAGAGFCVSGAKPGSGGTWKGGSFFTWAPDTLDCKIHYKLKDIPVPGQPGETTNPPFPSQLWGDYDRVGC